MIEIIPAIDLIDGRCVRLSQGDYERCTQYKALPEEMVKMYADAGIRRVHVVDLDGAKAAVPRNLHVLERMASLGVAAIEWGGGLKSDEALRDAFNAGADYAIAGSIAVKSPATMQRWLSAYGGDRVILGADLRQGKVSVNGWLEDSSLTIDDVIGEFLPHGLTQVICTDISKDGMLSGPHTELYTDLQSRYPSLIFTVSGGISSMDDIIRLNSLALPRVIVGKAIYENRISLRDIESFITRS
ncbi:MAG: 1-(5-phosphoribosyl)-5-[(5-phosphoribosylamino)methylideneamino] imidazole-4-carboxamide isomerase [Barnesiella sp.]|nr:1-(5-phosphoribosyl)-5-[(5-phosphoribosylamino)methylideneamino] imidazole-4-carboxamide isomerase [Barnesiella sp.]MBD5331191.1 1-(5-phosphoribosyl)-5-[(5-phosphoribosylamino)methylideneamino] imidazole-4-carboxamide isomerase [Bacteroides sp.]